MNRSMQRDVMVFVALVAVGAALRVILRDLPNFAPVAALALFAGYFFQRRLVAISVPLAVMVISDFFIGAYSLQMMAIVYTMLVLPAVVGGPLRRWLEVEGPRRSAWRPLAALLTCSLGASLAFFFVTNFGAWVWFDNYASSWSGLVACYLAALPFFRFTLAGDLIFAVALFGSYAIAREFGAKAVRVEKRGLCVETEHGAS